MKRFIFYLPLVFIFSISFLFSQPEKINIWPDKAPGSNGEAKPERWRGPDKVADVSQPDLTLYLAKNSGTPNPAILVCPGGGYWQLVIEKEGYKVARWLQENGISAFVLKYRTNPLQALPDAQRALSLIRANAEKWHIDADKVGMLGFSAGAHLAGNVVTQSKRVASIDDEIDNYSFKPDFWAGVYGAYEGRQVPPFKELVDENSPPAFLAHAQDDDRVPAAGSENLHKALLAKGVASELHIYPAGGHGFALETDRGAAVTKTVEDWSKAFLVWLEKMEIK